MRVAIVHERFTVWTGSERVVEQLHLLFPAAPIHAAVVDRSLLPPTMADADIRPTPLQRLYPGGDRYAHLLPLLPVAMARIDLDGFDAVVTSHHAFANRVRPPAGVPVLSYTHTPARWLWEPGMRRDEIGGAAGRALLGTFAATQRRADRAAAARLRGIVANSHHVASRIERWWHRSADVVAPPVDVERFTPGASPRREDFFLLAGRLVPYKRPLVAVEAARRAGVRLVVAGDGRQRREVEARAGDGVELLGAVDDATLLDLYRRCRALVFPGEEDFGIIPVEAQACGAPVVAPALGGVLDTVRDGTTGTLYRPEADEVGALAEALRAFDPARFDTDVIRAHAEGFSPTRFRERFLEAASRILGTDPTA